MADEDRSTSEPRADPFPALWRLHEVENVWVCDGGTWPTSAAFNPVLTQQALAYRTAAHMLKPGDETSVIPNDTNA